MTNFTQRTITGFLFVLVLLWLILYSYSTFLVLMFTILTIGLNEFFKFSRVPFTLKAAGILTGILLTCLSLNNSKYLLPAAVMAITTCFIIQIFSSGSHKNSLDLLGSTFMAQFYVTLPCILMANLSIINNEYNYQPVIATFIFLWVNDTGAYLVGRKFGKTKMFERISPQKTWEGTLGGVGLAVIAGVILQNKFEIFDDSYSWIILSIIVSITGTIGDLIESMFKRSAGVKDSGTILPGHGGILDRFDSFIFAIPFVFSYFYLQDIL